MNRPLLGAPSMLVLSFSLGSTLLLAGCGDDPVETGQPPAGTTPTFHGGDPGAGPAVYLRAGASTLPTLSLEIVGRALPNVYGLAFRLEFSPGVLAQTGLRAGPSWSPTALLVAREPTPGLLVVGLSERGSAAGSAATDDLLGTVDFQIGTSAATPVTFIAAECAVVQASGEELPEVAWIGGSLELN
jgi:hypothetical protein